MGTIQREAEAAARYRINHHPLSPSPRGRPDSPRSTAPSPPSAVAGEDDVRRWVLRPRRPQGLRIRPSMQPPFLPVSLLSRGTQPASLSLSCHTTQAATGTDPPAIRFADSNLQTFPPSEARGKIAGAYRPPTDADGQISRPLLPCSSRFSSDPTH